MITELPIQSKYLIFEYHRETNEVMIYNKKTSEFIAYICVPKNSKSYWWQMEKGVFFDERCTQDLLKAIKYLKELKHETLTI